MNSRVPCPFCPKTYSNVGNMNKHKNTCSERGKILNERDQTIIEMQHAIHELQQQIRTLTATTAVSLTVNNIHQEVHGDINVNILCFGSSDELNKVDFSFARTTLMENPQDYVPTMIKHVHNNSQIPENQNIVYDQLSKTIFYLENGKWIPAPSTGVMTQQLADKVRNTTFLNKMLTSFPDNMKSDEAMTVASKVNQKIGPLGLYDPLLPENSQKICDSLKKK